MQESSIQATAPKSPARRKFIGQFGVTSAAALAAGVVGFEPLLQSEHSQVHAATPTGSNRRANDCAKLRRDAAQVGLQSTPQNLQHPPNGDESLYANKLANYSKGLPHNNDGTVVLSAYEALVQALNSGRAADFNAIPLGGNRRLTNPQAGLAFDMEGPDAQALVQPPAPAFASREQAAEISENYWMALLRDVPYSQYSSHPIANAAAADLTLYGSDFKGAKTGGAVTPATLFRGLTSSDTAGPYLSQFFYQSCNFGANKLEQKIRTTTPGIDYMTNFNTWLAVQRGVNQSGDVFDPTARYMRNGRDIGQWVHIDVLFQAYFHGFLILAGLGAPFDDGNPYIGNPTQDGFGTFGGPHIAALLCEVATRALKAVWFQKWFVHRRLRPEVHAARVDRTLNQGAGYPVHPEILNSLSSGTRLGGYMPAGNSLLPMAFPEGSPTHPAYGAGHATVAGACVTILKAWFKESTKLVDLGVTLLQPLDDGTALVPYAGTDAGDLTVGGELNKLASNVALGRNTAGVHWRSDGTESMKLGEQLAIGILGDQKSCYNETFAGFSLTKFDGTQVTV
ncbi:MAG TPA: vanadium-dependent haloperoxidase [Pyrinomonadaceae bacterium]|nr:vanadium-dependent haloperoxidase [Pyrinomonadaceae bacterium]